MSEELRKYIITSEMQKLIDWPAIMKMERYAGGHDEQMKGLFKGATVIAHWNEGDYQGMVATCVRLEDGRIAIYNDYYGSCSGCDSWEGASSEDVKSMCIDLANGAHIFNNIKDVKEFLKSGIEEGDNYSWFGDWSCPASNLLKEIEQSEAEK
jgi:hypothetical protein